jgi:hypothetical protein
MRLHFSNSLKVHTSLQWPLDLYGAQPFVLRNEASIGQDKKLKVNERFIPPHAGVNDVLAEYSVVNVTLSCQEVEILKQ